MKKIVYKNRNSKIELIGTYYLVNGKNYFLTFSEAKKFIGCEKVDLYTAGRKFYNN